MTEQLIAAGVVLQPNRVAVLFRLSSLVRPARSPLRTQRHRHTGDGQWRELYRPADDGSGLRRNACRRRLYCQRQWCAARNLIGCCSDRYSGYLGRPDLNRHRRRRNADHRNTRSSVSLLKTLPLLVRVWLRYRQRRLARLSQATGLSSRRIRWYLRAKMLPRALTWRATGSCSMARPDRVPIFFRCHCGATRSGRYGAITGTGNTFETLFQPRPSR